MVIQDMSGIDTDIVQHCITTDPIMKPVKQKLRRMKLERTLKIKEEVENNTMQDFLKWLTTQRGPSAEER